MDFKHNLKKCNILSAAHPTPSPVSVLFFFNEGFPNTASICQNRIGSYHGHSEGQRGDQEGEQHCLQQHGHLKQGTGYM